MVLGDGHTMIVNRAAWLLVEPIDSVTLRPVHIVIERWVTT